MATERQPRAFLLFVGYDPTTASELELAIIDTLLESNKEWRIFSSAARTIDCGVRMADALAKIDVVHLNVEAIPCLTDTVEAQLAAFADELTADGASPWIHFGGGKNFDWLVDFFQRRGLIVCRYDFADVVLDWWGEHHHHPEASVDKALAL